jgi:hypothetical protein
MNGKEDGRNQAILSSLQRAALSLRKVQRMNANGELGGARTGWPFRFAGHGLTKRGQNAPPAAAV